MRHTWDMRDRRFLLLATVLVTLNSMLWLAPGAFGLTQSPIAALFGKNMVRADIVESAGCPAACVEIRVDRGIVVSSSLKTGLLTINEADGRQQEIAVASSTRVIGGRPSVNSIKPGWRVLVQWPAAGGPATLVTIEKRGKS
jgi:hypothetical protein